PRARAARTGEPRLHGSAGDPDVPGDHGRAAVEQAGRGVARPEAGRRDPRAGPPWAQGREGPSPRVPGGAPAAAARSPGRRGGGGGGGGAWGRGRRADEGAEPAVRGPPREEAH